jgi:hypothetical protein
MSELSNVRGNNEQARSIGAKLAEIRSQTSDAVRKEVEFYLVDYFGPAEATAMLQKAAGKNVDQAPDAKNRSEAK